MIKISYLAENPHSLAGHPGRRREIWLIGFLFVFLCPLALCVYYSMTAKSGGFSGLANYRDLWNSGTFRLALGNTLRFSTVGGRAAGGNLFSSFGGISASAFVFQPED